MPNLCAQSCPRTLSKPYYGSSNMQRGDTEACSSCPRSLRSDHRRVQGCEPAESRRGRQTRRLTIGAEKQVAGEEEQEPAHVEQPDIRVDPGAVVIKAGNTPAHQLHQAAQHPGGLCRLGVHGMSICLYYRSMLYACRAALNLDSQQPLSPDQPSLPARQNNRHG